LLFLAAEDSGLAADPVAVEAFLLGAMAAWLGRKTVAGCCRCRRLRRIVGCRGTNARSTISSLA
jgi:hypothetical protein